MLILLSPAKTLDLTSQSPTSTFTLPEFIPDAAQLIERLRGYSEPELAQLMDLSDQLAQLNANRYATWHPEFTPNNAKQALFCFAGDVYEGLAANQLDKRPLNYIQNRVRILSGLYGALRPFDLMQPYRLEMGTRLGNERGKDLYAFWGKRVTEYLNLHIRASRTRVVVNLASEEYFKVVKPKLLAAPVITPVFEDWKNGRYKIISFFAKRARGQMARYCALNHIDQPKLLQGFDVDGYAFEACASNDERWVFRRRLAQ
jgi:cytoplasmic iron level regulating protein YaaA (DUF328/UPF0246 family)